jgi:hypothetical protein
MERRLRSEVICRRRMACEIFLKDGRVRKYVADLDISLLARVLVTVLPAHETRTLGFLDAIVVSLIHEYDEWNGCDLVILGLLW